ncbi:MAG: hypothetical protein M3Y07_12500 [Acidobacteriota bacterium]|nr:hypothetical protein [Acidobacteriota bacterium]
MRIAIVKTGWRKAGGAEKYIDGIVPELASQGHDLAFCITWRRKPIATNLPSRFGAGLVYRRTRTGTGAIGVPGGGGRT